MCPFPQDEDGNFIGQTAATAPVTVVGLKAMSETMCNKMEDMSIQFHRELKETVSALGIYPRPPPGLEIQSIIIYPNLIYLPYSSGKPRL